MSHGQNTSTTTEVAGTSSGTVEQYQTDWRIRSTIPRANEVGFVWQSQWANNTVYQANDVVNAGGDAWICIVGHTATAATQPGVGVDYLNFWDLFASGGEGTTWQGIWDSGNGYEARDAVYHNGSTYFCLLTHLAPSPEPGQDGSEGTWALIVSGLNWRGAYSGGATYIQNDLVEYVGSSFIWTNPVDGNSAPSDGLFPPTAGTDWDLVAQTGSSFDWQGAYSAAVSYTFQQAVSDGGSSYIWNSLTPSTPGEAPAGFSWDLLAQRGDDGVGSGTVTGPGSSTGGNICTWLNGGGIAITDGGIPSSTILVDSDVPADGWGDVVGPASIGASGNVAIFNGTPNLLADGGPIPAAGFGDVTGPVTIGASGNLAVYGANGQIIADGGEGIPSPGGVGNITNLGAGADNSVPTFDVDGQTLKDPGAIDIDTAVTIDRTTNVTGNLTATGTIDADGNMSVGSATQGGNSIIEFHDATSATERSLQWTDTADEFQVEDNAGVLHTLIHSGNFGAGAKYIDAQQLATTGTISWDVANGTYAIIGTDYNLTGDITLNIPTVSAMVNGSSIAGEIAGDTNGVARTVTAGAGWLTPDGTAALISAEDVGAFTLQTYHL